MSADGAARAKIKTVITYLEMTAPPTSAHPPTPAAKVALMRAEVPTQPFYRFLYDNVGGPWLWWERRVLDDADLSAIIFNPKVEIYVLYVGGVPAGFAELDTRQAPKEIELAYFGLMEDYVGRGFGGFFLRWAIDQAWNRDPAPRRLWVNTCTLDHPNALAVYQRQGFSPYRRETKSIDDERFYSMFPKAIEQIRG